ncbi:MAG: hypothetical protein WAO37_09775, partial [Thermacetogeniaceae bacterium]
IHNAKLMHDGILKNIVFAYMGFHAFYAYHIQRRFVNHPRRPIKGKNLNRIGEALKNPGKQFSFAEKRLK